MAAITDIGSAVRAVADGAGRSVVRVGGSWRSGSGFVIGDGLVLTNAHNVGGERLKVSFTDGRRAEATLRGVDLDGDLAVLAVDTAGAPALDWTDGEASLGDAVFGLTLTGSGGLRATVGWISGVARPFRGPRGRRIAGGVEHTAPLAPGSSGSPLVDADGRVIGINTNRLGGGFYIALPADSSLRARIDALGRGESAERPRLGVGLAPARAARRMRRAVGLPERDGLLVRAVEDGSPASVAGIAEGDLLVAAAGRQLADADDLYEVLGSLSGAATLELTVLRGADERTVTVSLGGAAGGEDGTPVEGEGGPVH